MTVEKDETLQALDQDYQYGFKDEIEPIYTTGTGLSEEVVRQISAAKKEPDWMLDFRLKAYQTYLKMPLPAFGPDLTKIDFDHLNYFRRDAKKAVRDWDEVPDKIKETFEKLGVPQAERQYLAGSSAQYESEVVYEKIKEDLARQGVLFMSTDAAVQVVPDLVKKYFGKLVKPDDNKMSALNSAVWSGGTFIYVPKGVQAKVPIQSYFRINAGNSGQFERTLIIVDEGASVNYVEGCTAPNYSADSLHAAVVEVNVLKDAYCRYTTIQNWSDNVYSLETKRAQALENATMEWVDGNLGSKVTMKYPSVYLNGRRPGDHAVDCLCRLRFKWPGDRLRHWCPDGPQCSPDHQLHCLQVPVQGRGPGGLPGAGPLQPGQRRLFGPCGMRHHHHGRQVGQQHDSLQ